MGDASHLGFVRSGLKCIPVNTVYLGNVTLIEFGIIENVTN